MNSIIILDLPNEVLKIIFKYAENDKNLRLTCFKFWELICDMNKENESLFIEARYLTFNTLDLDRAFETSKIEFRINELDSYKLYAKLEDKIESFLRLHGQRVTHFGSEICLENFMTKFIPLLPNLQILRLYDEFPVENLQIQKFSVKVKQLVVFDGISEDCLEVFDIEELELLSVRDIYMKKYLKVLQKWKNLKKLEINCCYFKVDITKALQRIKLEQLKLEHVGNMDHKMLGNFLKNQKFLKEFQCFEISKEVWTILCGNLKQLEVLTINFNEMITTENFRKISKLTKLKSLTIKNRSNQTQRKFTQSYFEELTKTKSLQNLEYLELEINFELTTQHIVNLETHYPKLNSLVLDSSENKQSLNVLVTIYEQFNQLNCLKLNFDILEDTEKELIEEFLSQNHQNLNLKELQIKIHGMEMEKLIKKISRDFPNLEKIRFYDIKIFNLDHLQMILTELKNLKTIARFIFHPEYMEILHTFGQNLEKFKVHLNAVEDPDKLLEGCGLKYFSDRLLTTIRTTHSKKKDKMEWTGPAFRSYCEWKKLRTMMDSKREIKNMHIDLHAISLFCAKNLSKSLEIIGENVKTLFLENPNDLHDIKLICEAFPNCEILKIKTQGLHQNPEQKYFIESSKIKVVYIEFSVVFNYEIHNIHMLSEFLKRTQLSALKKLTLTFSTQFLLFQEALARQTVLKAHQECLIYQPQLKKLVEKVDDIKNAFILEFSDE